MIIDHRTLSDDAIKGIAEQFVISQIPETEEKPDTSGWTKQAISQVKNGELLIEFSEIDESVTLKHVSDVVID